METVFIELELKNLSLKYSLYFCGFSINFSSVVIMTVFVCHAVWIA